ncbi:hypothetical protein POM88_017868 [Heracleum sosnowskyi]|uniref:Uncharacterized protein n=1 Tax=Heracleum sosnowskyi TaxID=360622 RepID=A0AAD8IPZ5_9APIA|nr:hypothetical protein POM88_017868 [Heracleum sosnowskyi]
MQLLSKKKNEEELFVKLGSKKDMHKEAGKEVKAQKYNAISCKALIICEELGERYYGPGSWHGHGPGRGSGPGPRGGHGGIMGDDVPGPKIEDQQQFPTLGSK